MKPQRCIAYDHSIASLTNGFVVVAVVVVVVVVDVVVAAVVFIWMAWNELARLFFSSESKRGIEKRGRLV